MNQNEPAVEITFRIPGTWGNPGELIERLPSGYRMTPESLVMPDGTELRFTPAPPDTQFAGIFQSSCRIPATPEEAASVNRYTVNCFLSGPGGSLESALLMMQAASALINAGGIGVFIDNSALAHGGSQWLEMTEDGGADALSFAYVSIVAGKTEVTTMGMHTLGLPEVIMSRSEADAGDEMSIIEVIRYLCASDRRIDDGHVVADLNGPRFRAKAVDSEQFEEGSPMFNPWGRLRLVSFKDIAESN